MKRRREERERVGKREKRYWCSHTLREKKWNSFDKNREKDEE